MITTAIFSENKNDGKRMEKTCADQTKEVKVEHAKQTHIQLDYLGSLSLLFGVVTIQRL